MQYALGIVDGWLMAYTISKGLAFIITLYTITSLHFTYWGYLEIKQFLNNPNICNIKI